MNFNWVYENDIIQLATNAINSSFLSENEKSRLKQKLEEETVPILRQLWIDGEMKLKSWKNIDFFSFI